MSIIFIRVASRYLPSSQSLDIFSLDSSEWVGGEELYPWTWKHLSFEMYLPHNRLMGFNLEIGVVQV
jgi:hypothetical protein